MITKFKDFKYTFILESKLYDLILEAKIEYFKDFEKVLTKIEHPIAKDLLDIIGKDIDLKSNFFDLTENPGKVSFYNPNQSIEVENRYEIVNNNKCTHHMTLYRLAGIEERYPCLPNGTKGELVKVWNSENSNEILRVIVYQFLSDKGETNFLFEGGLKKIDYELKGYPQETTIGRLVQRTLKKLNKSYTSKDIENFVNKFKSEVKVLQNRMNYFELVSGDDIAYWYSEDRYYNHRGTLQSSCMRYDNCQTFFGIYTDNPDKVSLLILKSEDSENEIKDRALVWKLDNGDTFMDRVYYTFDEDLELFIKYANKNNWVYKALQKSDSEFMKNGEKYIKELKVSLDEVEFDEYPYVDTLTYLYFDYPSGYLSNKDYGSDITLDDEEGRPQVCRECSGEGEIQCPYCYGTGETDCEDCHRGYNQCSSCLGVGEFDCPECEGTGEIENEEGEMEDCSRCDGESTIKCEECNGDGELECQTCWGRGEVECQNCYGNGKVDCPEC